MPKPGNRCHFVFFLLLSLLLPIAAQAQITAPVGIGAAGAGPANSRSVTTTQAVPSGATILVASTFLGLNSPPTSASCSDGAGNTYHIDVSTVDGNGLTALCSTGPLAAQLPSASTIQVQWNGVNGSTIGAEVSAFYVTGLAASPDETANSANTNTSLSATLGAATSQANELLFGVAADGGVRPGPSGFAPGSNGTANLCATSGSASYTSLGGVGANPSLFAMQCIVSAAATYSANATFSFNSNHTLLLVPYKAAAPPTFSKSFAPASVAIGGGTTLSFTVTNPNASLPLTGVSFTDALPAGLTIRTPNNLTGSCGAGTITATAGTGSVQLSAGTVAAGGSCSFSIDVATTSVGTKNNLTSTVSSNEAPTVAAASGPLTVTPGPATHFAVSAPSPRAVGSSFSFTVTALDQFNNTATGYGGLVHFTSSDGASSLPSNSTLASGTGSFSVIFKTSGNQTITATDTVSSSITGTSNTVVVNAGPPDHLSVSAPGAASAGTAFNFTVTVRDFFNNTATSYTGTVHFTSTDGASSLPADSTLTNGAGTFPATLRTLGGQTIAATDTVDITISAGTSATITVGPGAATHFSVSAPGTATAGTAFNFTVTALDQFNNTATGYAGNVHFTSSDGSAVLPANSTLTNGAGTFSATLKTAGNQTITAADTVTSSITGTSNTVAVSGAAATHFSVSAPGAATAGIAFNFTVTAQDQFNNTATGYAGTVHFTSADGIGVLPANSGLTNGTASFSATLKTAGNQTITATDTVTSSITGTSATIAVSAAAATHFTVSAPATATAGSAFNFTVTALDQFNNTATGYAGSVHFTSGDGSAVLPANSSLTNGTGSFSATLKTAGNQTITATDSVSSSITGTSNAVAVSAAATTHLSVSAPGAATAGTAFNITVTALDQFNNTATGYGGTVHFTSADGIAVLPANATLTNGIGTFSATLKTPGNQTITATDTVSSSITGTSGSITVSAGATTHFTVSAPATTTVGNSFSFTVTALDALNNRAMGYAGTVHFTSTDAAASLPANSTLSAGLGSFVATLRTAGNQTVTATDTVSASIAGTSGTITVPTPPPPASSSVTLSSSANPSSLGQAVTFAASIGTSGGPSIAPGPTGSVQFFDSGTLLGSAAVSGGQATFTTSALPGGHRSISAQYSGDSTWPQAQGNLTQTVNATVTMTLTASPAAPVFGQTVTLTANVNAAAPTGFAAPTGQVTFQLASSVLFGQNTALGVAVLSSGVASISVSTLPAGTDSIVAVYSGDTTWTSRTVTISVTVAPPNPNVSISLALVSGQLVLNSVVSAVAPATGTPTGSVRFVDTLLNTTVANATLNGGKASATLNASAASSVIGRAIEALYSGDADFQPAASATLPVASNAAANLTASFAPDEIASLFGITGLNGDTPAVLPLTTSLAGATVTVTDSTGAVRPALLYGVFGSTGQINFLLPGGSAAGLATVTITLPGGATMSTVVNLANAAPAVFTANMTGQGPFAGQVVVVHADGTQSLMGAAVLSSGNVFTPNPIQLSGPGDQVYLVLYGTGLRHTASLTATVNGVNIPVTYFGAQGGFAGLDQINLGPLPARLAGAGLVNLVITTDGQVANTVTVIIQ